MPYAQTHDGFKLYYEEAGSGFPAIFVHEFAGDHRSWEPQIRFFSRWYRCIAYSARGYPPSDIPERVEQYSQDIATQDISSILKHLNIDSAHVVGLSMGGFATLHFGFRYPGLARSLVVAGCGYGADPDRREVFRNECEATANVLATKGSQEFARTYALGATRVQFQNKDPRGWAEFHNQLSQHSAMGSSNTMRGVQMERPSLWDLKDQMKELDIPTLVVVGDEDEPCLEPALFMKRNIRTSAICMIKKSGHTINLEEPAAFNNELLEFFHAVENGRWGSRDPRSLSKGVIGLEKEA